MAYKEVQAVSDVPGLQTALDAKQATASKGGASGYAGLDSSSMLPVAQLTAASLRWTKYTVGYAALATAGLTNDIQLLSLPAKGVIHAVHVSPTAAFTGGAIAAYTLSVGIVGNLVKYLTAVSVFTTGLGTPQSVIGIESLSAPTSIRVAAISTVGLLSEAAAGSADIWVLTSTLP